MGNQDHHFFWVFFYVLDNTNTTNKLIVVDIYSISDSKVINEIKRVAMWQCTVKAETLQILKLNIDIKILMGKCEILVELNIFQTGFPIGKNFSKQETWRVSCLGNKSILW